MSDGVANSYYSSDGKAGQSIHPCQSAWMAHWGGTGCDTSTPKHNYSFSSRGGNSNDHETKPHQFMSGAEIARSAKGFRVEQGSAENIKGLDLSSRNLTDESLGFQLLPTRRSFNLKSEQGVSSMQALRPQASRGKLPAALNILPVSAPIVETLNGECQFQPEGLLQRPVEQVKYHMFFGESNYSCSRQISTVPASHSMPNTLLDHDQFKFDSGRALVPSFIRRQEETKQVTSIISSKHVTKTNLTIMGQEHCNYQGHSAVLVCEEKTRNFPECEETALKIGPSLSTYKSSAYDDGQYHGMQNHFRGKSFPSSSRPSEMNKPRNLQYEQCTLKSLPHCVHDVLDSAEGLAGGQSRFSQTTHSLLITKHTDFGFCKENQILGESIGTARVNQHAFSELHRTFPLFNRGKPGVKLQLLSSSMDNEEKEDAGVAKTSEIVQKNESSAETEFMDMESFKGKNHLLGVNPPPSNKDMPMDANLAPQSASTTATVSRKRTIELPDINLELPASPESIEKPEPSTSQTQSLDMDLLLGNADKPGNSKSSESELSSRWVKRLKLATPNSAALRIKNSNPEEPFSHKDVNKFFNKTMKGTKSSSETTMGSTRTGKELMALDKTTKILQTGESSSGDTGMKEQDIRLSHSWIQRWRRNQAKKKPETLVTCDPQISKLGAEDLEKKQFPSIAAMALMGKVMNGFQPCQFKKKGSFVVWNTKNL